MLPALRDLDGTRLALLWAVDARKDTACTAQDLARVARWMAGKAVGLVLSGGGSRGLAHLGVLHALDDAGVPVDVIGGTSQVTAAIPKQSLSAMGREQSLCLEG